MSYKIFVINPGSTSTKLNLYEDMTCVKAFSVFHDSSILLQYPSVIDQLEYRYKVILDFIKENDIDVSNIDAIVGRGGGCYTVESGVYVADELMLHDIRLDPYHSNHASSLGVPLALKFAEEFGGQVFMTNPTCVDELIDVARITGIKGVYRKVASHCLNLKGTGAYHAENVMHKPFEECNFVIAHIDGGTTICASRKGRQIDCNDGAGGDGPFAPTRCGGIAVNDLLEYIRVNGMDAVKPLPVRGGGFASLFGTSSSDVVHQMIDEGDTRAKRIWDSMIYNCIKYIGSMAAALDGEVDAILLTGGLLRFKEIGDEIAKRCSWIAPVYQYCGEFEDQVMAKAAMDVLTGKLQPKKYTGKPVWDGFPDEQE